MSKTMQNSTGVRLTEAISSHESSILEEWIKDMSGATRRADLLKDSDLRAQCAQLLKLLKHGVESGNFDLESPSWQGAREMLADLSRSRAQQGFTPTETAVFVLSMKKPLFAVLRDSLASDPNALAAELWSTTQLVDSLGLYTDGDLPENTHRHHSSSARGNARIIHSGRQTVARNSGSPDYWDPRQCSDTSGHGSPPGRNCENKFQSRHY